MKTKFLLSTILCLLAAKVLLAQPTIASFSPNSGPAGTLVTITGTNLGNPTAFSIGGKAALVLSNTGTQLVGYVMPGTGTGVISLTTASGTGNSTGNFSAAASATPSIQKGDPVTGPNENELLGQSVALSADGTTAIVGAPFYRNTAGVAVGQALVYAFANGSWTQQAEFSATTYNAQMGESVALSADGNTAMVGGTADDSTGTINSSSGAIWFFARSGGTWTEQGKPAVPSDYTGTANIGVSCSLSADGNTALFGGSSDNHNLGAAWVFTRAAGVWTQSGSKLLPSDGVSAYVGFGISVALSADGTTAVIGGAGDNTVFTPAFTDEGATWVFTRSGNSWHQQGGKLVATGTNPSLNGDQQGTAVGVSADGNTLITAAPSSNSVWIFTRSSSTWTQLGQAFAVTGIQGDPASSGGPYTGFGNGVSLSADGNTAMIGDALNGFYSNSNDYPPTGGTWFFTRSGNSFVQQAGPILGTGTGTSAHGQQGNAVALSADGSTGMIGGIGNGGDYLDYGAAWFLGVNNLTAQTITFGPLQNQVYGAPGFNANAASSNSTIAITYASSNTAVATIDATGQVTITGAGNVTITASQAGNNTYSPATPVLQSFTVSPAQLTATAVNKTWTKGETEPILTETYSGFVYNDKPLSLTVQPNITTTATTTSPLGPYPISISGAADPNYTITYVAGVLTLAPSKDANLKALQLAQPYAVLTPATGPGTKNYIASVSNTTSSIDVVTSTDDPNATLTINGQAVISGTTSTPVTLSVGANTITLVVTAQDNTTMRTYIITVTRKASNNAYLSSLQLQNPYAALTVSTGPGYKNYTASVSNASISVSVLAVTADPAATLKINSGIATSGAPYPVNLIVGSNTLNIVVTAADGQTKANYIITVTRAPSSNANLAGIQLAHPYSALTTVTGPDDGDYTAMVTAATTAIDEVAKTVDPTAVITINGTAVASGADSPPITLVEGSNTITTVVTAQDKVTTKTYVITVIRPAALAHTAANSFYDVGQPGNNVSFNGDGITVHQGLSPNGDGINDFLKIDGIGNYPDNKLQIMDRDGLLVYEAKSYDNSTRVFDGHSSKTGHMQLPGTYFFSLDYIVKGVTRHKTGYIVLKY